MPVTPLIAGKAPEEARVLVVGTGPVGLAMAIELGMRGHHVTVLGRNAFISDGSKAICFSKRSLDILDRLGVGEATVKRGVAWNLGKVFWQDRSDPIYQFDLLPVKNQKMPGFINLQQYLLEELLLDRISEIPEIDLRWGHQVIDVNRNSDCVEVEVQAQGQSYNIRSDWLIACDGSRSTIRKKLGLDFEGRVFEDNFLIADIRMKAGRPAERWFWFDPPFNPGRSVLLHKQPDDVWRLDFQLGSDIDPQAVTQPDQVSWLVRSMLGPDVEFTQEWCSVYTFQCRRLERFVHDRVIFAGDSAHLVSPFGARGCNGGFADIDNLGWKLDLVLNGKANPCLLESYNAEAITAADENILNSTRSTEFITPKSVASRILRDAVLELSGESQFARKFVNSGRLSTAVGYPASSLNTPDPVPWKDGISPGFPILDVPLGEGWLLERLGGRFVLLSNGPIASTCGVEMLDLSREPNADLALERLNLGREDAYLVRPDHYVAARFRRPASQDISKAVARACAMEADL